MKGDKRLLIVLVLFASLVCAESARSRKDSSSQNSFKRAANGFYQALSSVFGEENIRGLYKVRCFYFSIIAFSVWAKMMCYLI